jgi:hypothetical protein
MRCFGSKFNTQNYNMVQNYCVHIWNRQITCYSLLAGRLFVFIFYREDGGSTSLRHVDEFMLTHAHFHLP